MKTDKFEIIVETMLFCNAKVYYFLNIAIGLTSKVKIEFYLHNNENH